ncbi:MAG: PilN domain-containing protein [Candidatus Omnitrophota bacterium]
MTHKYNKYITISINPSCVKAAQVTSGGFVEKLSYRAIAGGAIDGVLRDALTGFQTRKAGIVCLIPGDVATTKFIDVPSVDNDEIESILALQASRHTPFSKDEILTGYVKIRSPRPNFTSVLLVVVKRQIVKDKIAAMRLAGLDVAAVTFVPEGVARLYAQMLNFRKGVSALVIDADVQNTHFIILAEGTAVMARSIPVGIEQLKSDPAVLGRMASEAKASVDAFVQEGGVRPTRVILTSDHPALAGLEAPLTATFELKAEYLPYQNFVKGFPGLKQQVTRDFIDDSAIDVLAAGVTIQKCGAELLPQDLKDQRMVAEKGGETMKAGVFVLMAFLFIGAGLLSRVYFKELFYRQNLVEKYSDQKNEVNLLEKMIVKTDILHEYVQNRQVPLDAVSELYRIIPEEIYLVGVSLDDKGEMLIQGISESMSRVFTLVTALEESPVFENVKTRSTTARKERGKDVAAFEIVFKLSAFSKAGGIKSDKVAEQGNQGAGLDK